MLVVKRVAERGCVVLQDSKKNNYIVSERHLMEEDSIEQVTEKGKDYLVANWRKVSENSEWVRADKAETRGKITLADLLA